MESFPRASVGSLLGGLLFGTAWLLWIDGVSSSHAEFGHSTHFSFWIPGVLQTLSLVMVNVINWQVLTESAGLGDDGVAAKGKCWVFFSFMLAFSGIIGATPPTPPPPERTPSSTLQALTPASAPALDPLDPHSTITPTPALAPRPPCSSSPCPSPTRPLPQHSPYPYPNPNPYPYPDP